MSNKKREVANGFEAYNSPEFRAFCERFGIPWNMKTKEITLHFNEDLLTVTQVYLADEEPMVEASEALVIDTTTLQNEKWRTCKPPRNQGDMT